MMVSRKPWAAAVAVLLLVGVAHSQEPIRFARTPDISPDGKQVTFSYLGDIWSVETIGGIARPVTMHEAHDLYPVFSPDGRWIAFTSNRHGSYDVYVVSAQGGKPRRLTFDSAADLVNGWSPDGKQVLFSSSRSTAFPPGFDLFTVPVEGGRVRQITPDEGRDGVFSPQGDRIAYVRGAGTWYRKGYRGSSNDDVWICNADGSNNRRLTDFNGQDTSPMWSADGQSVYYVSEYFSTQEHPVGNIVCQDAAGKSKPRQVTFHTQDSVRRARISRDGEWIVYECGPDLWVISTKDGNPRRLAIEVHADDKTNTERTVTLTSGASEFAVSPDEKHVAFVVHGQIFLVPTEGGKATRMTESTAYDHGVVWSSDGKKILFSSDRNGHEDLYLLEPDDVEHPELTRAHKFKTKQITFTPEEETSVSFMPDGKRVGFIRAGKLWTMKPDGSDQKVLVNESEVIDYEWSPDSKWVAYARMDGSFASEIYIVPVAGGTPHNVTRYATFNTGITWSKYGHKLAFISQRRQSQSLYVLSLQRPAVPGAPRSDDIDWDDIHLRVSQPAPFAVEEGAIAPDGRRVAFRTAGQAGSDLWVANVDGGQMSRLTAGNQHPQQITWSKQATGRLYFRDGSGSLRMGMVGVGEPGRISFQAKLTIRRDEEFAEMFEQSWRALADNFYDPKYHGADWNAVHEKYRPLVKHVALKEDLYSLISLMMGELNASHLGIMGFQHAPDETTAELGLLFDESYTGPGLKVAEILKHGPADKRGFNLKQGDVIIGIDRTPLTDRTEVSRLLNDKVNEVVLLDVIDGKNPKLHRRVEIQAISRDRASSLMYERWVAHNAQRVAERSGGKIGYIHIPSMDEAGLDRFLRSLYSDNFDKDAIVLDVRFNGGGFTHDQILNYLGGHEHTWFRQRYGGEGLVLRSHDRKWTRPLVLLINNRSYSDAEIFPNAFRTLGLGKLVGQPTGGYVIGTSAIRLIDGSLFRVPRLGVYTAKGINMEKEGVAPDVLVEPQPDQLAKGIDVQLDRAVDVLKQDVVAWKKQHGTVALKAPDAKTGPAAAPSPANPIGK
jgi:tricorn protease